jgi:hypothetical protein
MWLIGSVNFERPLMLAVGPVPDEGPTVRQRAVCNGRRVRSMTVLNDCRRGWARVEGAQVPEIRPADRRRS